MLETAVQFLGWEETLEEGMATPGLLSGEFHGQSSPAGYSPQGRKESDMTEPLFTAQHNQLSPFCGLRCPWESDESDGLSSQKNTLMHSIEWVSPDPTAGHSLNYRLWPVCCLTERMTAGAAIHIPQNRNAGQSWEDQPLTEGCVQSTEKLGSGYPLG